jgi:hypothetical protein
VCPMARWVVMHTMYFIMRLLIVGCSRQHGYFRYCHRLYPEFVSAWTTKHRCHDASLLMPLITCRQWPDTVTIDLWQYGSGSKASLIPHRFPG